VGIEYENFDDLDAVLEEARVSFVPKFAAPETNDRFLATMAENSVLSAKRLIYVALTRARERLVLEWHSHLTGSTRTTYHSVFQEQTGIDLDDEGLKVGDVVFRCWITENDGTLPDLPGGSDVADNLPTFGRRALESIPLPKSQAGMFLSPSSLVSEKDLDPPPTEEVQYGHPLILDMEISGAEYGTFIHRCFEILTSSPDAKSLLSEAAGRSITDEQATVIATSHDALLGWFAENMFATSSTAEFPFSVLTADGSVCTGLIDLLIETPDGFWIIDYKTDRATDEGVIFAQYWPQLQAYREALLILGHDVAGVGLNLVNEGKLLLSKVPTSDTLS